MATSQYRSGEPPLTISDRNRIAPYCLPPLAAQELGEWPIIPFYDTEEQTSNDKTTTRLDLTVASHVHLLEPQWSPMAEEQALDRVHRMGQLQEVVATRYVVKNSIEEVSSRSVGVWPKLICTSMSSKYRN